ncbi:hypothetical protein NSK_001757 [Nannochloropsis salina CCMP1776]|uniref:Uncharacterized protein n=1 Tax=Nannochloropsis salina CCMP1776 TaxID=1027361 RepID=A0A4D9DD26_9STRA|nr:hypothetical protein NSK_001757 [Nannochloropsis salina CCMP1776]|eukprot:TFJ87425.1 hypothetical protein NSK_001757 [Nannochloropsis salina CCMP1776]
MFGGGVLMQPTPTVKRGSPLYIWKFWGSQVQELFSPIEIKHEYYPCLSWEETSAATATAMQEKVDEKTEGKEGEKCTRIGESVEKRCVTPWKECHTQEGEETEDEVRQTDQEKAEGEMILACKEKAAIENEIVKTRTQNVRVQLEWMEARHHADKLTLNLIFAFKML